MRGAENFQVSLNGATNATIANGSVTTVIHDDGTGVGGTDDDRLLVTSVSSPTVGEGGNLVFTVNLSGTSTTATLVNVTPASGTATLGWIQTVKSIRPTEVLRGMCTWRYGQRSCRG